MCTTGGTGGLTLWPVMSQSDFASETATASGNTSPISEGGGTRISAAGIWNQAAGVDFDNGDVWWWSWCATKAVLAAAIDEVETMPALPEETPQCGLQT